MEYGLLFNGTGSSAEGFPGMLKAFYPKMLLRILGVFSLVYATSARAEDSLADVGRKASTQYFAEFYSYEGPLNGFSKSHTFARFFKMQNGAMTEVNDISWLPAPNYFRRNNKLPILGIVPGHNYSLGETMGIANGKKISSQGQFPISPALFEAAKRRKAELEGGALEYRGLGGEGHPNCIQAVAGVLGQLRTGVKHGVAATDAVVKSFLDSGEMGPQWKNGVNLATSETVSATPSGYRPQASAPLTHGSQGVRIYPAGIAPIPNRQPILFRRR